MAFFALTSLDARSFGSRRAAAIQSRAILRNWSRSSRSVVSSARRTQSRAYSTHLLSVAINSAPLALTNGLSATVAWIRAATGWCTLYVSYMPVCSQADSCETFCARLCVAGMRGVRSAIDAAGGNVF